MSFLRYSMSKNVITMKSGSEVTQGHWKWSHSIEWVRFPIWLQTCPGLENWASDPSRTLKMSPFDTAYTTSCWCSIVIMALSNVVSEIFIVEKCRDLEIGVRGHSIILVYFWSQAPAINSEGARNIPGWGKIYGCQLKSPFISETVQDKPVVAIER